MSWYNWYNHWYTIRHVKRMVFYRIIKFDDDLNYLGEYSLITKRDYVACSCKRRNEYHCRHRMIFTEFVALQRIDTGWFFGFNDNIKPFEINKGKWMEPISYG